MPVPLGRNILKLPSILALQQCILSAVFVFPLHPLIFLLPSLIFPVPSLIFPLPSLVFLQALPANDKLRTTC